MKRAFTAIIFAFLLAHAPAQANVLVTDLSKDQISIRGDFTGERYCCLAPLTRHRTGRSMAWSSCYAAPAKASLCAKQKSFAYGRQPIMGPLPGFWQPNQFRPLIR